MPSKFMCKKLKHYFICVLCKKNEIFQQNQLFAKKLILLPTVNFAFFGE